MLAEKFCIQSIISDTLRNGLRDDLNRNPDILGFILGAIDNGFQVKLNGFRPTAKKGKVQIFLQEKRDEDGLKVIIFKGKEKQGEFDYNYDGFMWVNVNADKGRFNVEIQGRNSFICSFN